MWMKSHFHISPDIVWINIVSPRGASRVKAIAVVSQYSVDIVLAVFVSRDLGNSSQLSTPLPGRQNEHVNLTILQYKCYL
jgi:hypothetical protein